MRKKVLVPIADGSEEIEAVCIIDVLRRAGAEVTVASVEKDLQITASRGVRIVADARIDDCANEGFDLIVLPGGMPGAERLRDSKALAALLRSQKDDEKPYAAICAAPAVALQPHGLLEGRKATTHPGFVEQLKDASHAENRIVVDGSVVTSRAPGTAIEFALALVVLLFGEEKAEEVAGPMLVEFG